MPSILALIGCVLLAAEAVGGEISTQQLIDLAPRFSLGDPNLESFRLVGTFSGGPATFSIDVAVDRPKHIAMRIYDGDDRTPLITAVDGGMLIYDVRRGQVVLRDAHRVACSFILKAQDGKIELNWSFDDHPNASDSIDIDVRSLLTGLSDVTRRPESDGDITLTGTTKHGGELVAKVHAGRRNPYTRIDLKGKDSALHLTTISRDEFIPVACWHLPPWELRKTRLPVVNWDDLSESGIRRITSAANIAFRSAIKHPELRSQWEQDEGKIDWDAAQKRDSELSEVLRHLMTEFKGSASAPSPDAAR